MFQWFKNLIGWEKEISGKIVSNERKISRSKRNSSHKNYYKMIVKNDNDEKGKEIKIICWKSNVWPREWKIIKRLKQENNVKFLVRKKWFSKHVIIRKIIAPKNILSMVENSEFKTTEKEILKLSYIDPNLWWKRSLDTNSKEWKELRIKILERDNYACFFCGIKASKYMIIDHISGDAMNNETENLRVLCAMCDTIRHSGLAGIEGTLKVRISKLNQLEIIKRTREFFLKEKRIPKAKEIDPESVESSQLPIEFAVLEGEERPEEWKKYQGFFTRNFFGKKFTARFLNYLID